MRSDALLLFGSCLVCYGVHLLSVPAGLIAGGAFLLAAGVLEGLRERSRRDNSGDS